MYLQGSTLSWYAMMSSSRWNSFSATIQLASNRFWSLMFCLSYLNRWTGLPYPIAAFVAAYLSSTTLRPFWSSCCTFSSCTANHCYISKFDKTKIIAKLLQINTKKRTTMARERERLVMIQSIFSHQNSFSKPTHIPAPESLPDTKIVQTSFYVE